MAASSCSCSVGAVGGGDADGGSGSRLGLGGAAHRRRPDGHRPRPDRVARELGVQHGLRGKRITPLAAYRSELPRLASPHRRRGERRIVRPAAAERGFHHQRHQHLAGAAGVVHHLRQRGAEHRLQALAAQPRGAAAEQLKRTAVGTEDAAIGVDGDHALLQRAKTLRRGMQVQLEPTAEAVSEPLVLNHARRHARQRQRVRVVGALVARHVDHAQHAASVVKDRRGRTGEEVVGAQKVLARMNHRGLLFDQRRAHRVGALGRFRPHRPRRQRDPVCALQKVSIA